MTRRIIAIPLSVLTLVLLLVQGCSGGTTDGDATSVPVDVPSMPDTVEDVVEDVDEVPDTDALSVFPSDLPVITEIDEDVDLSDWFPDAGGAEPDAVETALDTTPAPDTAPAPDVISESDTTPDLDVTSEPDTTPDSDATSEPDAAEDAASGVPDTFLSDCDNLGVAPAWEGSFQGAIEYHIPEALETLFSPPDGILIVGGELAFNIECVDSKLIVSGDMDGAANVAGEGDFPFQVKLAGYFDPNTGELDANMVEGMVILYELAEIQFSGAFSGTLVDGAFVGDWTAQYDGTNFPLPPGDEPEAEGLGTWTATATEAD